MTIHLPVEATAQITTPVFEQFLRQPENADRLFELVHGEIREKLPTQDHGIVASRFVAKLSNYLDENPIGNVMIEARHRPTGDERNDRLPDVAVVLGDQPISTRGVADYMPDICIEVQSPDDTPREMREKADFYLEHGAKMVILAFPKPRVVEVITPDETIILGQDDVIDGGDLLPGFILSVRDVFKRYK